MTTAQPARSPVPWHPGEASRGLLTNVVGGSAVVVGWVGSSGTAKLSQQMTWVSVAIIGLLVAGTANVLWLLAGRRAVGLRLRSMLVELSEVDSAGPGVVPERAATTAAVPQHLVTVDNGTRFHRQDCVLVRGKPVLPYTTTGRRSQVKQACEACRPDAPT